MKILAVDTSTSTGSVALLEDTQVIAEWTLHSAQTHNRRLLKTVDLILRQTGCTLEMVNAFAVTIGPGSFTGLRIGLSTIKSMAWVLNRAFVGIPSLDALAAPLSFSSQPVCALLDARKNEIYFAIYHADGKGNLKLHEPYRVIPPIQLTNYVTGPTLFCGDGWLLYRDLLRDKLGSWALEAPGSCHAIRAGFVGELAYRRVLAQKHDDPMSSVPLYVRLSEAELNSPHLSH
jgi:tRNA threonylcarbamoyladenosine biosynthesis protein TsaB